jgi:hypothetical protein
MSISGIQDLFLFGIHVNGGASLLGFGTIKIARTPTSYTTDKRKIVPPQSEIVFEEEFQKAYDISVISDKLSVPGHIFNGWSTNFLHQFANPPDGLPVTADLPGIGKFENKEGKIHFNLSKHWNEFQPYRNFPSFDVISLPIHKNNISFVVENPKALIFEGKKSKSSFKQWIMPLSIIGMVVLFILLKECSSGPTPKPHKDTTPLNKATSDIPNEIADTIKTTEEVIDTFRDNQYTGPEQQTNITENKPVENQPTTINEINSKSTGNLKTTTSTVDKNKCTYIVGAFKIKKNALKLIKSLKKQGFEAQMSQNGDFYRVGINSGCVQDTSKEYGIILKKFPDVWLLEE